MNNDNTALTKNDRKYIIKSNGTFIIYLYLLGGQADA